MFRIHFFRNVGILQDCGNASTATLRQSHRKPVGPEIKRSAAQMKKKLNGLVVEGCLDKRNYNGKTVYKHDSSDSSSGKIVLKVSNHTWLGKILIQILDFPSPGFLMSHVECVMCACLPAIKLHYEPCRVCSPFLPVFWIIVRSVVGYC